MISEKSLKENFPRMKYWKFLISAFIRIMLGYMLLVNGILVVVQASEVLEIFYDVLALQFIQQLDDIAFNLAKMDVFGKALKRAATQKCFRAEFEKQPFGRFRKLSIFLKAIYFINVCLGVAIMIFVTTRQLSGYYQCNSVTITFGDEIWDDAIVTTSSEKKLMLYSYFNGVYKMQNETHDGRPVYVEQRKSDGNPFESKVGAQIKYCTFVGSWVFAHEHIRKSEFDESDCPWLLKSPETKNYDLLEMSVAEWSIWTGVIAKGAKISVGCNECVDESDCNFNGLCSDQGKCECNSEHTGYHCEHENPCPIIIGEYNEIFSIDVWNFLQYDQYTYRQYDRPVYGYRGFTNGSYGIPEEDYVSLKFAGSRWFGTYYPSVFTNAFNNQTYWEEVVFHAVEVHAFWDDTYTLDTWYVSDPTDGSNPVGVDFYQIGERGDQFGPLGILNPIQFPAGRGYFRCADSSENVFENFTGGGRKLGSLFEPRG